MSEKKHSAGAPEGAEAPPEVPGWSAGRKSDVVMRLLRGDRSMSWPVRRRCPRKLEAWRRVFLATARRA